MKKKLAVVSATAMLSFVGVAKADYYYNVLNKHPRMARAMCRNYNTLVNLGWSDNDIFSTLNDATNISRTQFKAIVRWCFSH